MNFKQGTSKMKKAVPKEMKMKNYFIILFFSEKCPISDFKMKGGEST